MKKNKVKEIEKVTYPDVFGSYLTEEQQNTLKIAEKLNEVIDALNKLSSKK